MKLRFVPIYDPERSRRNLHYQVLLEERHIGVVWNLHKPAQRNRQYCLPKDIIEQYANLYGMRFNDNMPLRHIKILVRTLVLAPQDMSEIMWTKKDSDGPLDFLAEYAQKLYENRMKPPNPAHKRVKFKQMKDAPFNPLTGIQERIYHVFLDGVNISEEYPGTVGIILEDYRSLLDKPCWFFSEELNHTLNLPLRLRSKMRFPYLQAKALIRHILKNPADRREMKPAEVTELATFARKQELDEHRIRQRQYT